MPSALMAQAAGPRPDFVIGDRFGASCDAAPHAARQRASRRSGYDVQLNRPYAGGYITEHYGRPRRGLHAVQIEINRGLYLDETTLTPTRGFATLKANLTTLADQLFEEAPTAVRAARRRRITAAAPHPRPSPDIKKGRPSRTAQV